MLTLWWGGRPRPRPDPLVGPMPDAGVRRGPGGTAPQLCQGLSGTGHWGTVHAALATGYRAADQVIKTYKAMA